MIYDYYDYREDYEYINNAVRDNLLSLETSIESEMNEIFSEKNRKANLR